MVFFRLLGLAILITACSRKQVNNGLDLEPVIFPSPPDSGRIVFLTSINTSLDITGKRSGLEKYVLGEDPGMPINKPYGLAVKNGKLYICDSMLGGLEIIDLGAGTFEYFQPSGRGILKKPVNCAVDENNLLFVADTERKQVVAFDSDLKYHGSFGRPESFKPAGVAVSNDYVWVSDLATNKIYIYDKHSLQMVRSFPDCQKGDEAFLYAPANIAVSENLVYVSDFGGFNIKIFDHLGGFKRSFGSYGKLPGQFVRPKGIAVDRDKNIFVVDAGFENVQIFNKHTNLLMFFGGNYQGNGFMWLPAGICIDYDHIRYFNKHIPPGIKIKYLIFVANQYGPSKINVYGFIKYN